MSSLTYSTARRVAIVGAILAVLPRVAAAQDGASLPPAKALVDKFVTLTGGEMMAKRTSMRIKGKFEIPEAGLSGDLEISQARPNKMATKISIPGVGEVVQSFDGEHGWAVNPAQGPRLIEGKELDQMREEAEFGNGLRQSPNIVKMETVEKTKLGEEECYKVKVTWKSGRETFDCYSVATGLLAGSILRAETPMGMLEQVSITTDYKDFGGRKLPTRTAIEAMGRKQLLTIISVDFDTVEPAAFDAPPTVKTLIEKKPR